MADLAAVLNRYAYRSPSTGKVIWTDEGLYAGSGAPLWQPQGQYEGPDTASWIGGQVNQFATKTAPEAVRRFNWARMAYDPAGYLADSAAAGRAGLQIGGELASSLVQPLADLYDSAGNASRYGTPMAPGKTGFNALLNAANFGVGGGALSHAAGDVGDLGMFGGRVAARNLAEAGRPAAAEVLDLVQKMHKAGASRDEIWTATADLARRSGEKDIVAGWMGHGPEFELDDSGSSISNMANSAAEWVGPPNADAPPGLAFKSDGGAKFVGPMNDAIAHPSLYEAYPAAADLRTVIENRPVVTGYLSGLKDVTYGRDVNSLGDIIKTYHVESSPGQMMAAGPDAAGRRLAALHENQHLADHLEGRMGGFAAMSDPLYMRESAMVSPEGLQIGNALHRMRNNPALRDLKDRPLRESAAVNALADLRRGSYVRWAPEVRARNVETRANLTAEDRRAQPPWLSEDVPAAHQVVGYHEDPRFAGLSQPERWSMTERANGDAPGDPAFLPPAPAKGFLDRILGRIRPDALPDLPPSYDHLRPGDRFTGPDFNPGLESRVLVDGRPLNAGNWHSKWLTPDDARVELSAYKSAQEAVIDLRNRAREAVAEGHHSIALQISQTADEISRLHKAGRLEFDWRPADGPAVPGSLFSNPTSPSLAAVLATSDPRQ